MPRGAKPAATVVTVREASLPGHVETEPTLFDVRSGAVERDRESRPFVATAVTAPGAWLGSIR
jgi:hypothetical protein